MINVVRMPLKTENLKESFIAVCISDELNVFFTAFKTFVNPRTCRLGKSNVSAMFSICLFTS